MGSEFKDAIDVITTNHASMKAKNASLQRKLAALEAENASLKRKLAALEAENAKRLCFELFGSDSDSDLRVQLLGSESSDDE